MFTGGDHGESPEPGEGSKGSRVEVPGSGSDGCQSRAGNPWFGTQENWNAMEAKSVKWKHAKHV